MTKFYVDSFGRIGFCITEHYYLESFFWFEDNCKTIIGADGRRYVEYPRLGYVLSGDEDTSFFNATFNSIRGQLLFAQNTGTLELVYFCSDFSNSDLQSYVYMDRDHE